MAQNISLLGANYSDVPAVQLPKTGGGTASFTDVTDTTAAAGDVASGKYFYTAAGVRTAGTASGPSYTLLKSQDVTVNTTSTSAATVATISCGTSAWTKDKILYVKVRDKAGKRNGYFLGSDMFLFNRQKANGGTTTVNNACRIAHSVDSSGNYAFYVSQTTNGYGVYGYSVSTAGAVVIQSRYHASNSLTINGTYNVQVYLLDYAPNQGNPYNYSFS